MESVLLVSLSNIPGLSFKASRIKHDVSVGSETSWVVSVTLKGFKLRFTCKAIIVLKARKIS